MPKTFFATFTMSAETEIEAETYEEALAKFKHILAVDKDDDRVNWLYGTNDRGAVRVLKPLTTLGLVGETVGAMG